MEGTKRNSADSASAGPFDVMLNRSDRQGFGLVFLRDNWSGFKLKLALFSGGENPAAKRKKRF